MNIYIASFFNTRARLLPWRDKIEALGHTVTSTWLKEHREGPDHTTVTEDYTEEQLKGFADRDLTELYETDLIVVDTFDVIHGPHGKLGQHAELLTRTPDGHFGKVGREQPRVREVAPEHRHRVTQRAARVQDRARRVAVEVRMLTEDLGEAPGLHAATVGFPSAAFAEIVVPPLNREQRLFRHMAHP